MMASQEKPLGNKLELIQQLLRFNLIKYGNFTLKCGQNTPYYVNLRELTMYPDILYMMVEMLQDVLSEIIQKTRGNQPIAITGVPYGVVPFAGMVAFNLKLGYYPLRKEVKSYGYKPDSTAFNEYSYIMIEDVMSTGSSIIEAIQKMDGKNITDVIILVDRESGGEARLKSLYPGIRFHSILKLSDIFNVKEGESGITSPDAPASS